MSKSFLIIGALGGFLTVAFGAFGAHALRDTLPPQAYAAFQTGVEYQGLHSLLLIAIGMLLQTTPGPWLVRSGWFTFAGILLFSGSLYLLALTGLRPLGMVTPIGGSAFLAGWLCLLAHAWQLPNRKG
jgi:uncharacterized membrane protein YgdD (TMEM256/DUF423 family)